MGNVVNASNTTKTGKNYLHAIFLMKMRKNITDKLLFTTRLIKFKLIEIDYLWKTKN